MSSEEEESSFEGTNSSHESSNDSDGDLAISHKERKRRKQESRTYGIWAEEEEDEEEGGKHSRPTTTIKQKGSRRKNVRYFGQKEKQAEYIASGTKEEDRDVEDNEDEAFEPAPEYIGLGASTSKKNAPANIKGVNFTTASSSTKTTTTSGLGSSKKSVFASAVYEADEEFGSFEKYTKGIGLNLLKKMGYEPGKGLGSKGQGIVNPLDVKARPKQMGMGYKGFEEQSSLVVAKESEEEKAETAKREEAAISAKKKSTAWKKGSNSKKNKEKITYVSVSEMLRDLGDTDQDVVTTSGSGKIIDMTGPVARELGSMSEIRKNKASSIGKYEIEEVEGGIAPELRHNVKLVIVKIEEQVLALNKRLKESQKEFNQLESKELELKNKSKASNARLQALTQLENICREYCEKIRRGKSTGLAVITELFDRLHSSREFLEEYRNHNLERFVLSLAAKVWRPIVSRWSIFEEPELELEHLKNWAKRGWIRVDVNISEDEDVAVRTRAMTSYEDLLYQVWIPKVRSSVNSAESDINRHSILVVDFLLQWKPIVPSYLFNVIILDQVIVPKLKAEIEAWNPSVSTSKKEEVIEPHKWLLDWMPILKPEDEDKEDDEPYRSDRLLTTILESVQFKLQKVLDSTWDAVENPKFGINLLRRWKSILPTSIMDQVLRKSVIPKLELVFARQLEINPADQNLKPFEAVVKWLHEFPQSENNNNNSSSIMYKSILELFEVHFFPAWLSVLHQWLSMSSLSSSSSDGDANLDEIVQWYEAWKSQLPAPFLKEPAISFQLRKGLDMMNQMMVKPDLPLEKFEIFKRFNNNKTTNISNKLGTTASARPAVGKRERVTFKEIVESIASEFQVTMIPTNRMHPINGKLLYELTSSSNDSGDGSKRTSLIWLDGQVLYLYQNGNDIPMSVEDVMNLTINH